MCCNHIGINSSTQLQVYYRGARKGNQGHRMQENPSAALAPPRTYSDPQTPGWWGGGWLPKKPHLALGIRAYRLSCSPTPEVCPLSAPTRFLLATPLTSRWVGDRREFEAKGS